MEAWLVPAITGVVAIASGWLGALWGRKNEHRQWLRNQRIEAYSELLKILRLIEFSEGTEVLDLERCIVRVQLVAPRHISDGVTELLWHLPGIRTNEGKLPLTYMAEYKPDLGRRVSEVIELMRDDLMKPGRHR